jgi:lipopolysaccharide/colanic/teichoic acid biosynthesis glycosyltransferase
MTDEHDDHGNLLPDEVRLTRFGEWLRKTSLDELPEAINILKGDISIVGPRPIVEKETQIYGDAR